MLWMEVYKGRARPDTERAVVGRNSLFELLNPNVSRFEQPSGEVQRDTGFPTVEASNASMQRTAFVSSQDPKSPALR